MSEELIEQPVAVKPRKPRSRRAEAEVETPEFIDLLTAVDDKDDFEIIRLHDNDDIAPGGQPFGVNGRFFVLRPNTWYKVPGWLLSTIDNCIAEKPHTDEHMRLVGFRSMKKYPYETFRG